MTNSNIDVSRATIRWDEIEKPICPSCGHIDDRMQYNNIRYFYQNAYDGEPTSASPEEITLNDLLLAFNDIIPAKRKWYPPLYSSIDEEFPETPLED